MFTRCVAATGIIRYLITNRSSSKKVEVDGQVQAMYKVQAIMRKRARFEKSTRYVRLLTQFVLSTKAAVVYLSVCLFSCLSVFVHWLFYCLFVYKILMHLEGDSFADARASSDHVRRSECLSVGVFIHLFIV